RPRPHAAPGPRRRPSPGPGDARRRLHASGSPPLDRVAASSSIGAPPMTGSLLGISLLDGKAGATLGVPMQITILMTLLALLPAVIMSVTPFLRISIVLHFLRQALGTQSAPSNQVLTGLALFLTLVTIQPLASQIYKEAWQPVERGEITAAQAFDAGSKPLKTYLSRFVREK